MKLLKNLTKEEKAVYDSLETAELKKQYLEELKDDTKVNEDNDNNSTNSTNNNPAPNNDIDSILDEEKKDLEDKLTKKEQRTTYNKKQQELKNEEQNNEDEKKSFLPYVLAVAAVVAVYFYVTKKLGFKGNEGINSATEEPPTENIAENSNRETEQNTESIYGIFNDGKS